MDTDIPIQCTCGELRAAARGIDPQSCNRVLCYCEDCQAFAHFLGKQDSVLDANGGSDIFQTSAARIEFTSGRDRLACMRLSDKGIMRWYAGCCDTPIGNTAASPGMPFVGLIQPCDGGRPEDDARIGPIRSRVWAKYAKAGPDGSVPENQGLLRTLTRFARIMIAARLRGDHKRSPFFDPVSGNPIVTPRVLSADERAALMERVRR